MMGGDHARNRLDQAEEPALRFHLHVAGQEHPERSAFDEQNGRLLIGALPATASAGENTDRHAVGQADDLPAVQVSVSGSGLLHGLQERGVGGRGQDDPRIEHLCLRVGADHLCQPSGMVVVGMAEEHEVEAQRASLLQPRQNRRHHRSSIVGPAVDQRCEAPRGGEQDRVTLSHIED